MTGCNVCGGKLAKIRGQYPREPDREFCPTCLVERLEALVSDLFAHERVRRAEPEESSD